jgi:predicted permease
MNWLQRFFKKQQLETELEKEIRDHLDRQVSDYRRAGLTEEEALRKARLNFGGVEQIREECREARGTHWLESTLQDLQLALRTLRKNPGFAITAIATLALGIGANTAIFALLDAVRLRSLPVSEPQKLALIQIEGGNRTGIRHQARSLSFPLWEQIHEQQRGFLNVFAWSPNTFEIGKGVTERPAEVLWVTSGFFSTLPIDPAKGRLFVAEDDRSGCGSPGAVISYGFWRSEFGGRDSAIGDKIFIQDRPTEIIGIAPPGFDGLEVGRKFDIALPLCAEPSYFPGSDILRRSDFSFLNVMGRLRPGWTLEQANGQLASISPAVFRATLPAGYEDGSHVSYLKSRLAAYPAANGVSGLREKYDTSLWFLLGITGLVLLIACANLANLMLVRASTREREIAVRLAIGASRWRIIRQLLTESLVLAAAGAAVGASFAQIFSRTIVLFVTTQQESPYLDLRLNWHILAFAAVVACFTCLVFGVVPAFRGSRTDPGDAIKSGSRGMLGNNRRSLFQSSLVISQVAISLVLLIAAALFVRSFRNLMTLDPGFRERGVVIASLDLSHLPSLSEDRAELYMRDLMEQLRALPQIESAGTSTHIPLDGSSWTLGFHLAATEGASKFTWVSRGYFGTMDKPLLSGRDFDDRDTRSTPRVAVVNQTFVRRFLGGVNPLGRTLKTLAEPNYPATEYEIIGVVKDAKYDGLREDVPPEAFGSSAQFGVSAWPNVFIRSSLPPPAVISAVRQKLNQISPQIRSDYRIFETEIQDGLVRERLMAALSGFFGVLAALLAAIGLYGVISYVVVARHSEIGVRLALGATRGSIIFGIVKRASTLLVAGTLLGLILALSATTVVRSLLYGIEPNDLATFLSATLFLLAVSLAASYIPARRASRLDPLDALRYE